MTDGSNPAVEILNHVSDVSFLIDAKRRLSWISPSVKELTGRDPESIIGHRVSDILARPLVPVIQPVVQLVRNGKGTTYRSQFETLEGATKWAELTVNPLFDSQGAVNGAVGIVRDITEEIERESLLKQTEDRFNFLSQYATDVIFQSGTNRKLFWVSPSVQASLGWTPEELVGTDLVELVTPESLDKFRTIRSKIFDGVITESQPVTARMKNKDGGSTWLKGVTHPVFDETKNLTSLISTFSNIYPFVKNLERKNEITDQLRHTIDVMFDPLLSLTPLKSESGLYGDFEISGANNAAAAYFAKPKT